MVIPKQNPGDYVFSLDDNLYSEMMLAVKKVAGILEKAFDTPRVALIFEGTGVAHVHAKLMPLHGDLAKGIGSPVSHEQAFYEKYPGWLTTADGPKMDDAQLDEIQARILVVQVNRIASSPLILRFFLRTYPNRTDIICRRAF